MPDRVTYVVLTYQRDGTWYAEVPDLDNLGVHAASELAVLAGAIDLITGMRAATRAAGDPVPAPQRRCHQIEVDA